MVPPEPSSEATWPRFCEAGIGRAGSGGLGGLVGWSPPNLVRRLRGLASAKRGLVVLGWVD